MTLLRGANADEFLQQVYPLPVENRPSTPLPMGDSALCARLLPIAKTFVDERSYNGHPFAFVVLQKGGVVAERYDEGITSETKLLSWSMAKSFTNALVGG